MSNEKARNSRKIRKAIEEREETIINIVFNEFMRCLKPKPALTPLIFLAAFWKSMFKSKETWAWFTRTFVYDLSRAQNLSPERFNNLIDAISKDVDGPTLYTNGKDAPVAFKGKGI